MPEEHRLEKASRHYLDALNGRSVRHSVDCSFLLLVFDSKLMKFTYKVQTDKMWQKVMFLVSWFYIILTLFEPTHVKDIHMQRWDQEFTNLFACELTIILLLSLDFVVSFYHNFYDSIFRESAFFNTESLIQDDKASHAQESSRGTENKEGEKLERKRRTTFVDVNLKEISRINEEPETTQPQQKKTVLELSKETFSQQKRGWALNFKIFFKTFLKQFLIYKLIMVILFFTDFGLYFHMYPHSPFRFSRFLRTLLFPIFNKSTRRTLQAIFHSVKRIFDYFIFFFSIIFMFALLGYKIFYDDNRSYYLHPFYDPHQSDYNSYLIIVNSLMVMVTFDNYPLVLRPFYEMSPYYLLYFLPFFFVNILFFKPVPIAVVYDGFRVDYF